jgi:transposase
VATKKDRLHCILCDLVVKRWSILPAMTVNGYIAFAIFQEGFNQERFNTFLEYEVLLQCKPYPEERSVILLDNASIHHSSRVAQLCEKRVVLLEYLQSYFPDFNCIEQSFKHLKDWIRQTSDMAKSFNSFEDSLMYGIKSTCIERDCRGWFQRYLYEGKAEE